ncbi:hypothetical protein [Blastomonas aquatica]|uniref:Uncharacterized protein n=1 Tax=Blastomonas aquatica TaxID=1510276 RepID=A0ABQ1J8W8_9SPHN|nr:hypothetical protein [Blastomonas aquatica]GGB61485.1 hypothetical protein GCM10010833_15600 [Blastomonas aquatica]
MLRSIFAFIIAPFPAGFFQASVVAIWPKHGTGIFEHPLSMFIAICLLFYMLGLVFGIPLLLFSQKRWHPSSRGHALGGAAVMALPIAVALGLIAARGVLTAYVAVYNLAFFAAGGAIAGVLFYRLSTVKDLGGDCH